MFGNLRAMFIKVPTHKKKKEEKKKKKEEERKKRKGQKEVGLKECRKRCSTC
jgi:hypothetical protein